MKLHLIAVTAAVISAGVYLTPAIAQSGDTSFTPPQATKKYSAEEKADARAKRKTETAEARKNGEIPAASESAPVSVATKKTGSKESRSAERKATRKAAADDRKTNPPKAESSN
jgi:hypothetical protein